MGLKTITVYFNTGFDGLNIPGRPSVLDNATSREYSDFYYLRESVDLPIVKIRDNYDNLADVDYVKIHDNQTGLNTFYFATPHAEARGTTSLALVLDALLTMGGAENLQYTSGWITRGHIAKSADTLFGNTAAEDFTPSKPLIVDGWVDVDSSNEASQTANRHIVVTSVDLSQLEALEQNRIEIMQGMNADGVTPAVTVPLIRATTSGTAFHVPSAAGSGSYGFMIPGVQAYDRTQAAVKNALSKLFSAGQLQLASAYSLPPKWTGETAFDESNGSWTSIRGWSEVQEVSEDPFEYNTVRNRKALAIFRTSTILSLATGDKLTVPTADIRQGTEAFPRLRLWADPSPTGKPFCAFASMQSGGVGTGVNFVYARSVHGAQWPADQLVLEGASGSAWNSISAAFAKAQAAQAYEDTIIANNQTRGSLRERLGVQRAITEQWGAQNMLKVGESALGVGTAAMTLNPAVGRAALGAAGGLLSAEISARQNALAMNELTREAEAFNQRSDLARRQSILRANEVGAQEARANAVAPTVLFTPEINLGYIGYNYFAYYETRLHPQDIEELDMYFQRYGYNGIHIPLTTGAITSRQYFNFVQAHDIGIKSSRGMRVRERGIEQLAGGVRIWHVLPDRQFYEDN